MSNETKQQEQKETVEMLLSTPTYSKGGRDFDKFSLDDPVLALMLANPSLTLEEATRIME